MKEEKTVRRIYTYFEGREFYAMPQSFGAKIIVWMDGSVRIDLDRYQSVWPHYQDFINEKRKELEKINENN